MNAADRRFTRSFIASDQLPQEHVGEAVRLSVILPIFNERETLSETINQIIQVLEQAEERFEIIAVNDGSTDGSDQVLHALANRRPDCIRVISSPYNKGMGQSVKQGIRVARGEVIACMDADGQHDPNDLIRMLPFMADYELVVGSRHESNSGLWYRGAANRFYNLLASRLTDFPIRDLTSGFRLFRASAVKKYVHLFPAGFSASTTSTLVFLKSGYSVKYIPIHIRPRQGGASKITLFRDGWKFLIIIFKVIVLYEPLRIFLPISILSFLLATISTAYNLWLTGIFRITNTGVVLFVLGVLVLLLGLISEQITALQVSLREGPD
jgi:glycosyltransferase involved in cell wall biosynthesis